MATKNGLSSPFSTTPIRTGPGPAPAAGPASRIAEAAAVAIVRAQAFICPPCRTAAHANASGASRKPALAAGKEQNESQLQVNPRPRQWAPVAIVLVLTVAGFLVTRALGERDARRDATHRAEIAATRAHDSVAQATALVD